MIKYVKATDHQISNVFHAGSFRFFLIGLFSFSHVKGKYLGLILKYFLVTALPWSQRREGGSVRKTFTVHDGIFGAVT